MPIPWLPFPFHPSLTHLVRSLPFARHAPRTCHSPNYSQLHYTLNLTAHLAGEPGVGWVLQPQPAHAKGLAGGSSCVWMDEHMYCVAGALHPDQVRTAGQGRPTGVNRPRAFCFCCHYPTIAEVMKRRACI